LIDTARLSDAFNPLTLATYSADVEGYVEFNDPGSSATTNQRVDFKIYALDAADNIIASNLVIRRETFIDNKGTGIHFVGSVTTETKPISRIVVGIVTIGTADIDNVTVATNTTAKITAYEETADIAARPIHVCVLEGLNASATINLNSSLVLTGVPDSTNVFISSAASGDVAVYDSNMVEIFLKSVSRVMPRAFSVEGHGALTRTLDAFYGSEPVSISFKAMSFEDVRKGVQKAARLAKKTGSDLTAALAEIEPMLRGMGMPLSTLPGPAGMAGNLMLAGADMGRRMR
jgi:hypothetical protein